MLAKLTGEGLGLGQAACPQGCSATAVSESTGAVSPALPAVAS